jgi:tetratricopeptide (TPR) repeat protein
MQTARKAPSLRAAAPCGACFAVLLGIVGSTTASDAPNFSTEASIRIGPKQRNREYSCRGSLVALPRASQACGHRPVRWLVLSALLLIAASASGNGTEEATPTENLDYQAGLEAIQSSDWKRAISNLNVALVAEPTNADLQNWLGYAYRHAGKYDEAFDHYRAALHLNPEHRGAHEYIGETYLLTGNKAKAREHLAALERICGAQCAQYLDLQRAITTAK